MVNTLLRYPICLLCFLIHFYVYGQQVALAALQQQSNNNAIPLSSDSAVLVHQENNPSIPWHNNQKEQTRKYFWVNSGLGETPLYNSSGSATISLNYQRDKCLFTARYVHNFQYLTFSEYKHIVRELGLLYGLSAKGRVGYASIGAGVSLVSDVVYREEWFTYIQSKKRVYTGPGIPLETQLFLTTRYVGIGLILLANINPHHTYVGYLLSLQAGKLKNKRVRL